MRESDGSVGFYPIVVGKAAAYFPSWIISDASTKENTMNMSILKPLKLAATAAFVGFALFGCNTSSETDVTTDGGNVFVSQ